MVHHAYSLFGKTLAVCELSPHTVRCDDGELYIHVFIPNMFFFFFGLVPDILLLASALKDLSRSTRTSCTALWCALQMTLPEKGTSAKDGEEGNISSVLAHDSSDQVAPEIAL